MRLALLSLLAAPLLAQAASSSHLAAAHRRNTSPAGNHALGKREGGIGTWFYVGLGACGWWNNNGDYVVAMNQHQFPNDGYPSSVCGKKITITGPTNRPVTATIADMCPYEYCEFGSLDMSQAVFQAVFGDLGVGRAGMTWYWGEGGDTGGGGGGGGDNGGGGGGGEDPKTIPWPPNLNPNKTRCARRAQLK